MKKIRRIIILIITSLVLLGVMGFVVWAAIPAPAFPSAVESLQTTSSVQFINTNDWLIFTPINKQPTTGLIFYPGARVDPRAYAPAAEGIAADGYLVVIVPMPLNMAIFDAEKAQAVIEAYPQITIWAVGGHSLGGAMAAQFAGKHPDTISGLVLLASYPAKSNDLSSSGLSVLSISASEDGLATADKINASRPLLPADTTFLEIKGGNHAGFGWYGPQKGDGDATVSKSEQQASIVAATAALLNALNPDR
jgi:hypothetical protein